MSNIFWKYFIDLFSKQEKSSRSNPVIHEPLVRDASFEETFDFWKHKESTTYYLKYLHRQFTLYKVDDKEYDDNMQFLNTPSKKGIIIENKEYHKGNLPYLFDYLRDEIKDIGYRLYMSDYKIYTKKEVVIKTERHYLKPPLSSSTLKFKQHFGNIEIDLNYRDDKLKHLKIGVTSYNDRNFETPMDVKELYKKLFYKTR